MLDQFVSCYTAAPEVLRNDEVDWETLSDRFRNNHFDNVVISPGPGTPERETDIGETQASSMPVHISCMRKQAL